MARPIHPGLTWAHMAEALMGPTGARALVLSTAMWESSGGRGGGRKDDTRLPQNDTNIGEFRAHYAGFFDPGFGSPELNANNTKAVLEVRSHDVPFIIEDGQTICRLIYEPMSNIPEKLYGEIKGKNNYQSQGLKLSKHFV